MAHHSRTSNRGSAAARSGGEGVIEETERAGRRVRSGHRGARFVGTLLLAGAVLLPGGSACAADGAPDDRVRVYYPVGECDSGIIEIEVFDRASGTWIQHPEHWHIVPGTCQLEDPGRLLQELRYRCADPKFPARNSDWIVGVEVFSPISEDACAPAPD